MKTLIMLALSGLFSLSAFADNHCRVFSVPYNNLKKSRLSEANQATARELRSALKARGYSIVPTKDLASLDMTEISTREVIVVGRNGSRTKKPLAEMKFSVIGTYEKAHLKGSSYKSAAENLPLCENNK